MLKQMRDELDAFTISAEDGSERDINVRNEWGGFSRRLDMPVFTGWQDLVSTVGRRMKVLVSDRAWSNTADQPDLPYSVGYKKPPKATQVAKGRSGNPNGRPKKLPAIEVSDPFLAILEDICGTALVAGVTKDIKGLEAMYRGQALAGGRGVIKAIAALLKEERMLMLRLAAEHGAKPVKSPLRPGGVLIVPAILSLDEWEAIVIGELYAAVITNGQMAHAVNQHGYDVVTRTNERILVKTTGQTGLDGHISLNRNTLSLVDRVIVLRIDIENMEVEVLRDAPVADAQALMSDGGAGKLIIPLRRLVRKATSGAPALTVAQVTYGRYEIHELESGTIEVNVGGVQLAPVKPVLRELAMALNVSLLNSNGKEFNTRQLGTQVIRSIQAFAGFTPPGVESGVPADVNV